jgi:lysophospholipase L1-like esterase
MLRWAVHSLLAPGLVGFNLTAHCVNGYPQMLARTRRLAIVDMSCGGAVTKNLLDGGQFFQGPQIRTITRETKLVTITVGGNDVAYIGDLSMLAARNSTTLFGRLVKLFWGGSKQATDRDYDGLRNQLTATLAAIRRQAPKARIFVVTYPTILPSTGTCEKIGLTDAEAATMRVVGDQLAETTRMATEQGGAILVDMNMLGRGHHACSSSPWTAGWTDASVAPFHPTMQGANATAAAISAAIDRADTN